MKTKTKKNRTHTTQQKEIKYFTKQLILEAAQKGPEWDFNRQLKVKPFKALPDDIKLPVVFWMFHEHRHLKPSELHIRCIVQVSPEPNDQAVVDVPMKFWEGLPVARI